MAPNAKSRMMNVSGIVSRSDWSRPSLIRVVMSSPMNVLLTAWMTRPGLAARASSRIGRIGTSSAATRSLSPGTRATIRTVEPSAETSPASGGAWSGSTSWSKVGVRTPSMSAPAAWSLATRSLTAVLNAGSPVAPGAPPMTTRNCSYGSFVPPALKTSSALVASSWRSFGPAFASAASIPPRLRLKPKMPIVATNQRVTTNQRCRALHIATRTVAGSLLPWWAGRSVVIAWVSWGLACRTDAPPDAWAVYGVAARTTILPPLSPRKASRRCPSASRAIRSPGGIGSNGSIASVFLSGSVVTRQPPGEDAIDEDRPHAGAISRRERDAPSGRDDPRAIVVAEQDVVVLGQEARRGRGVGVGTWRVGEVEQLATALVTERLEQRPQPLDDLAQAGQARPRLDVHDR